MEIRSCKESWRQGDKEFLAKPSGKAEHRTIVCGIFFLQRYVLNSLNSLNSLSPNKTSCLLCSLFKNKLYG